MGEERILDLPITVGMTVSRRRRASNMTGVVRKINANRKAWVDWDIGPPSTLSVDSLRCHQTLKGKP